MSKVFLVTKLKTTNLGNQALSMELIRLFEEHVGKENLFVGGRPLGLYGYSISKLKSSADSGRLFESWADAVVKKFLASGADKREFISRVHKFDLTQKKKLKFENIKRWLRPVKRFVRKFSLYEKSYEKRLQAINSCDYFIYSGAGEASDNHVFLRQMLELRIAQKLGKKTGAVNQSIVVRNESFKQVVRLVYGNMDHIVVRGHTSRNDIISFGVSPDRVYVAPDTAIRTNADLTGITKTGEIGINFTPFIRFDYKDVDRIIEKLRAYNRQMVFATNEPAGDIPIIAEFEKRYGIKEMEASDSYLDYAKKLSEFDYIISTRLHTNVMALSSHVPVIPIEGLVFKTRELFSQFNYPIHVVNVEEEGWVEAVLHAIDQLEKKEIDFNHYFDHILVKHKADVVNNVAWIN